MKNYITEMFYKQRADFERNYGSCDEKYTYPEGVEIQKNLFLHRGQPTGFYGFRTRTSWYMHSAYMHPTWRRVRRSLIKCSVSSGNTNREGESGNEL